MPSVSSEFHQAAADVGSLCYRFSLNEPAWVHFGFLFENGYVDAERLLLVWQIRQGYDRACRSLLYLRKKKFKTGDQLVFWLVLCPRRKCYVQHKECGNKTRSEEKKGPKSNSTVSPRPCAALYPHHKSRSELWQNMVALCLQLPHDFSLSLLFLFHLIFLNLHCTCWKKVKKKLNNPSYISARGGSRQEAKSPQTWRMLITCVLSQAQPGHPLWIKREIVSRSLIFHRPRDVPFAPFSAGSCAREIIRGPF